MTKQDLTNYSENELSLIIFNDETLYNMRHDYGFLESIDELFIYTEEQKQVLIEDLYQDLDETMQ